MSEMRLKIKLQVGEGEKLESQEFGLIPWRDLKIEFLQFSKKERNNDINKTLQSIYIYIFARILKGMLSIFLPLPFLIKNPKIH